MGSLWFDWLVLRAHVISFALSWRPDGPSNACPTAQRPTNSFRLCLGIGDGNPRKQ